MLYPYLHQGRLPRSPYTDLADVYLSDAPIKGFHWLLDDGSMTHDMRGIQPYPGHTAHVPGSVLCCHNGLHASLSPVAALLNAPGAMCCWVSSWGSVSVDRYKYATNYRRVERMVDATSCLESFLVRMFAYAGRKLGCGEHDMDALANIAVGYLVARRLGCNMANFYFRIHRAYGLSHDSELYNIMFYLREHELTYAIAATTQEVVDLIAHYSPEAEHAVIVELDAILLPMLENAWRAEQLLPRTGDR